jgi:hypothetical protein
LRGCGADRAVVSSMMAAFKPCTMSSITMINTCTWA